MKEYFDKREILFVPGRLCLFGEHTDWASKYMSLPGMPPDNIGLTLVAGICQGITAQIERDPGYFIFEYGNIITGKEGICLHWNRKGLKAEAEKGKFMSYVCGTAAVMFDIEGVVGGVHIVVKDMTLPIKKGLSSSAAVCVLVVKAFDKIYDLNLSKMDIMKLAFLGEKLAKSECGRMDQIVAYGSGMYLMMHKDGDLFNVENVGVMDHLSMLIVDLNKGKDTKKILTDLHVCFVSSEQTSVDSKSSAVCSFLKYDSPTYVEDAVVFIRDCQFDRLGRLMTDYQEAFDFAMIPACDELEAPRLHELLKDPNVKRLTYGGKGVGSGGDGCAQFVCIPRERERLIQYIKDAYGYGCWMLDL